LNYVENAREKKINTFNIKNMTQKDEIEKVNPK
jgi:hypothetical protein